MPLLTGEVSEGSHAHTHAHTHKQTQLQSWIEDRQNKKLKKMNRKSLFSSHAPVVSTPSALLTPLVSPSLWGPGGRTQPWSCQDTSRRWRIRFARQAAFASVSFCCSFYPFFLWVIRPSAFPPPAPLLYLPPSHHLSFPSMYIFRSRVIKSAPEGLCMKRRSLIFSQPPSWYSNTNTCIHAFPSHDQTANMFLAFISLVCLNCDICELYCIQNFQEVQLVVNWPKVGIHFFVCLN